MSGPFYGSLAASASVFVAILTALLVNNYIRIKSEQRQVRNELQRIKEDLKGLKERKNNHQTKINELIEKREADYREIAKQNVDEFIEERIPPKNHTPIEQISVDDLYAQLIAFHDCESPEELEHKPVEYRHRDILKKRIDEIENKILNRIIPSFAHKYRGRGQNTNQDSKSKSYAELVKEAGEEQENEDNEDNPISVNAEFKDPISLEEFIEKYREEYDLTDLDEKTVKALEAQYSEVVDTTISIDDLTSSLQSSPAFSSLSQAVAIADDLNEPYTVDFPTPNVTVGLNLREQQKLSQEQEKLRDIKNEISILENRKQRLKREREGLNPEDLKSTLYVNAATICLSVVIPMGAYLNTVTGFTIPQFDWVNIWIISGSWLLGLIFVLVSILVKINNSNENKSQEESSSNAPS
jgi:hypothetical protein